MLNSSRDLTQVELFDFQFSETDDTFFVFCVSNFLSSSKNLS